MYRRALLIAFLLALAVVCFPLRADDAAFTRQLRDSVDALKNDGRRLINQFGGSLTALDVSDLLFETGDMLLQKNAQLRESGAPIERRIPILRGLCRQQLRRLHELAPNENAMLMYNERTRRLSFYYSDSSGGGSGMSMNLSVPYPLEMDSGYDSFTTDLMEALREMGFKWSELIGSNRAQIGSTLFLRRRPTPLGAVSPADRLIERRLDWGETLGEIIDDDLVKLGAEMSAQNLSGEERVKKLREKFLETVQAVHEICLGVSYDAQTGRLLFVDTAGKPLLDADGNPIAFAFPRRLMDILGLKTIAEPTPPLPPPSPLPPSYSAKLQTALNDLIEDGQELVDRFPQSQTAHDLVQLLSEIVSRLLAQNEQMEAKGTPVEERIPILRDLYLQQVRRIHEMKTDGKSVVKYNERGPSLAFYSGGGSRESYFGHMMSVFLQTSPEESGGDFARELNAALTEFKERWLFFIEDHHLIPLVIVDLSPPGAVSSSALPIEQRLNRIVIEVMRDIPYELTKLDVEMAERKTPRKERVEKLRERFFEIARRVEKLGQKIQADGYQIHLLFYENGAPVMDAAGAPVAFTFPPKLTAALNIREYHQAKNRRFLLMLGGGAALALFLLAGVFLVVRRYAAKRTNNE